MKYVNYDEKKNHIGGLIMAGGKSSRMGQNKALLQPLAAGGPDFLQMGFTLLSGVVNPCFVSCAKGFPYSGYANIEDVHCGLGPAGGIAAGLAHARKTGLEGLLVLACDLPFLQKKQIVRLLNYYANTPEKALVCAYASARTQKLEMLAAIYSTRALPIIENALSRGERALKRIFAGEALQILYYGEAEEEKFLNCNTPEDLARIRKLLKGDTMA